MSEQNRPGTADYQRAGLKVGSSIAWPPPDDLPDQAVGAYEAFMASLVSAVAGDLASDFHPFGRFGLAAARKIARQVAASQRAADPAAWAEERVGRAEQVVRDRRDEIEAAVLGGTGRWQG